MIYKNNIKSFFKNKNFLLGFILIVIMVGIMLAGFIHLPYDPTEMNVRNKLAFFSASHLLGTDQFGRDILSRVMVSVRISFIIGFSVIAFGFLVGTAIGAVSGYYGGKVDEVIMKLIDTQMAFPGILLALMLIAIFGSGLVNMIFALGIMSVPRFARMTRSGFIKFRDAEFVKSARARGASDLRIMFRHIMPNIFPELAVTSSLSFVSAVMGEAGLSYLGLGIQPPSPSFGKMLSEAQAYILQTPWYVIIPAVAITLFVMGFNLLADGVQEINQG